LKREHNVGRDHQDGIEGDFYIPNYDRDGYTPGARYGQHTNQVKPQQSKQHTTNHHQYSRHQQRQQQSIPNHMQLLPTSQNIDNSKITNWFEKERRLLNIFPICCRDYEPFCCCWQLAVLDVKVM
jgi:hypothetical protein